MSVDSLVTRVERLREVAAEFDDCDTEADVYEHAVREADRILSFDSAIAVVAEDGVFRPHAVVAAELTPASPLADDAGIAGRTLSEGETQVVADVAGCDLALPTSADIRSVLSIPAEDDSILQFHASETDAFTETDERIGNLLAANVSNAVERVRYERALGQERDQFAALFENIPDAALQYRIEEGKQVIEAVNSAFVSTFGATGADIVGEPVESVLVPTDDCPAQFAEPDVSDNIEVVRETVDGPRPFLLRNVPIRTADELPQGYLIYTDMTVQKERERELEQKNERLDEFASILSHDLRNPLNVAQLYTEQERLERNSERLRKAGDALDRIDQLIDNVLTLTRSEQNLTREAGVNLRRAAQQAWGTVETGDASLEVTGTIDCTADRAQLTRLLENLFRNAVEHGSTSPDSQARQDAVEHGSTSSRTQSDDAVEHADDAVSVRVEPIEDGFAVEDDGQGIPPDERDEIFESGVTTEQRNTGLGLAIVDRIAETHGWSVTVTESDEGGARFEFRGVGGEAE